MQFADTVQNVKYYFSVALLIILKIKPKREHILRFGKALTLRNLMYMYEVFINSLEQDLLLYTRNTTVSVEFINEGKSKGAIPSYRKIEGKNLLLFEKIYFKDRPEWWKTAEFYDKIYQNAIDAKIVAPALLHTNEGEDLIVTYLEYHDLQPIKQDQYFTIATEIVAQISKIPYRLDSTTNLVILDYNSDPNFKLFKNSLMSHLGQNNIEMTEQLKTVDEYIQGYTKRCVCHGDLSTQNLFLNNILIDWDRFGFYPVGYDFAMVINHFSKNSVISIHDYIALEKELHSKVSEIIDEEEFKITLPYFTAIFLSHNLQKNSGLIFNLLLVLNNRYQNVQRTLRGT